MVLKNIEIYNSDQIKFLSNDKGYITGNVTIRGNNIISLNGLKKVYGNLGIDSDSLSDLGDLNYVKNNFYITSANSLFSLNKLSVVGGDIVLNKSYINDLGFLKRVGGKLNLRSLKIVSFCKLEKLKQLSLSDYYSNDDFSHIHYDNIKFWKGKLKEKSLSIIDDGCHYQILFDSSLYGYDVFDTNKGVKIKIDYSSYKNY